MAAPAKGDPADAGQAGVDVAQEAVASGQAVQAVLGSGEQHLHFGERVRPAEPAVSLAPPFGLRTDDLPIRGRDELLAELTGNRATGLVRVLHGLGGCGKTRLALEVAFLADQGGVEVWWVSTVDETGFLAGMRSVGRRLGVSEPELDHGDAADLIWRRLASRQEPWLLIIDNADDPTMLTGAGPNAADGRGWLRPLGAGSAGGVLVTSRDGSSQSWGSWVERIKLAMLTQDWAAVMLADFAGSSPQLGTEDDAKALAARLGRLPLALKIVGSSLARSADVPAAFADPGAIGTYGDYLKALDLGTADLLHPQPTGELTQDEARQLIGRTWDLTLEQLEARQFPEARPLIRLLACLADAPIPFEFLISPSELAKGQVFAGLNGARLWQVLSALDDVGLIDLTRAKDRADRIGVIRLHPLVRDTSRPDAAADDGATLLRLALTLVGKAAVAPETMRPPDPPTWPIWRLLTPHAAESLSALRLVPADSNLARATTKAAFRAIQYLQSQGLYRQSSEMSGKTLAIQISELGPDDPGTLETRHEIANIVAEQGRLADAETEFRDILTTRLRVLGPDHPDTLTTRHEIARMVAKQGRLADAETEYRDILTTTLRVQGPDHQHTLAARHEIARMMAEQGRLADAETEYRDILTTTLRVQGPDHPDTLAARHALAYVKAEQGHHAEAETEYRDILTTRLRVQGPDHPDTLAARHEIARMMAEQGRHADAETEYRDILTTRLRIQGPDHQDTLKAREWVDYLERRTQA